MARRLHFADWHDEHQAEQIAAQAGSHSVLHEEVDDEVGGYFISMVTIELLDGEVVDVPIEHNGEWDHWAPLKEHEWKTFNEEN